jgi:hypothetical protein
VESEGKAVSYLLLDTGGFRPFPLLFRKDGNMSFNCGQPSLDSFMGCGVTLPITNRRMDCVISRNELEIRLPPLGEAISGAGLPAGVGGGIMPELPGAGGFPGGIGG